MNRVLFFLIGGFLFSYLSCLQEEDIDFRYLRIYTDPISNITSDGARFSARIDFSKITEVTDFGFEWGEDARLADGVLMIPSDSLIGNEFYTSVRSSLISQKIYYVRSFVEQSGKTVYGNIVSFKSLGSEGPIITELDPSIAAFGDTVRVVGKNFTSNAKLSYGRRDISSSILHIEKNAITFVLSSSLPVDPDEDIISVSIEGNTAKPALPLKLDLDRILPKILSITPLIVKACDTITIKGRNLTYENKPVLLRDNHQDLKVLVASKDSIVCVLKTIPKDNIFLVVSNGRFSVASQNIDLIEQRPEIISVSPLIYKSKDIVTVKVKNLPYCDDSMYATIKGSNVRLSILSRTKDEIRLQLPEGCSGYFSIVFTLPAAYFLNTQVFETPLISPEPPEVFSIEPANGSFGDEIIIKGNNLNGALADIIDVTSTSATEIRGKLNQSGLVKGNGFTDILISGCGYLTMEDAFRYDPIEILDYNPKVITSRSQQITITGKNFSSGTLTNKVTIGSYTANLSTSGNSTIIVPASALLPDVTQPVNEFVAIIIENSVHSEVTSSTLLEINVEATWIRQNDFPFSGIYNGVSFSIDGKGYAGNNSIAGTPNFWQYDPTLDNWEEKARFPGQTNSYMLNTSANGKGYIGIGLNYTNEWWEYDPAIDTWNRKRDYPGSPRIGGFAFEIGNKVYVSSSQTDFWEYNPSTDQWNRKADVPTHRVAGTVNFGFKGKGYVYATASDNNQYEYTYNPNSNTWSSRLIEYFERSANNSYMVFQDYVVVGGESFDIVQHSTFLKIVPGSGNFEVADYAGIYRKGQIGFAIGNYGYWGLGLGATTWQASFEIWRFDPSMF